MDGRQKHWYPIRKKHCEDILWFLYRYHEEFGYMPNRREISEAVGIVVSSVNYYFKYMISYGWIEVRDGLSRAMTITPKGREALLEMAKEFDDPEPPD